MAKKDALDEAAKMMHVPMNQLPSLAIEYLKHLSKQVGYCGEVCITAYAAYNQSILGMKCKDESYKISDDASLWFKINGYKQ